MRPPLFTSFWSTVSVCVAGPLFDQFWNVYLRPALSVAVAAAVTWCVVPNAHVTVMEGWFVGQTLWPSTVSGNPTGLVLKLITAPGANWAVITSICPVF